MADTYRPERRDRSSRDDGPSSRPSGSTTLARRPPPPAPTDEEKQAAAQAEYNRLRTARSGGVYVPPARLRALQAQVQDKTSEVYQRMAWEALKKSINGLVNKATAANMREIINELFRENLVRGRGLLTQSLIKAQYASPPFTPVYACIAACINSKLPSVGDLLLQRVLLRFKKGFTRNDKAVCRSAATFLAHLVNTQVADEMLAAQVLLLLLEHPTNDSVEIAIGLAREVGSFLETLNPTVLVVVFDRFHHILNEADIDKRTQYAIEVLFQQRRDHFAAFPAVRDDLDLIEEEDQIKHALEIDDKSLDDQRTLNIFRYDADWEEHENEYARLRREILNESDDDSDSGSESGSDSGSDSGSESGSEDDAQKALDVKDRTNADLVALRRTIYLTIQSSMNADEAVHKLLAVQLPEGREGELPSMVVECCSQEKTYTKFFGLVGERLAKLNRRWTTLFEEAFGRYYTTIHRYDTSKLRNIACFFGHVLASDAIGWYVLEAIHLNEDETTSASRIFIKILFQEMSEAMGMTRLRARLAEPVLQPSLEGLFPATDARHLRFSINYFTSIGMGVLTEEMRERLQNLPKPALPAAESPRGRSHSRSRSRSGSVSSYSSYTGSSYSRSPSRTPVRKHDSVSRSRSPVRSRARSASYSRSPSPVRPRSSKKNARSPSYDSRSPSPPPRRRRRYSYSSAGSASRSPSRSPSPPRGRSYTRSVASPPPRRGRSYSRTASPPPRRADRRRTTRSPSRSPVRSLSDSRSRSRSRTPRSRTRSPSPARRPLEEPASGSNRRRRRSDSVSSRGSYGPPKKYRRND